MRKINLILISLFAVISCNLCFAHTSIIKNNSSRTVYVRISNDSEGSAIFPTGASINSNCSQSDNPANNYNNYCTLHPGDSFTLYFDLKRNIKTYTFRVLFSLKPDFPNEYIGDDGDHTSPDSPWIWINKSPNTRTSQVFECNEYTDGDIGNCSLPSTDTNDNLNTLIVADLYKERSTYVTTEFDDTNANFTISSNK